MTNFYIQSGKVIQCVTAHVFFSQWRRTNIPVEQIDNNYLITLGEDHDQDYYFG